MRSLFSFLIVGSLLVALSSCGSSSSDSTPLGEWYRESDFDGPLRNGAVLFMIGDVPYVGGGFNIPQNSTNGTFLSDFYRYEADRNTWVKIADFPGAPRSSAVAFSIDGKGYVGLGYDGSTYFKDFYSYDPTNDSWEPIADFMGTARFGSIAFSVSGKGFVGAGYDGSNYLKDVYSYNPGDNSWSSQASIGGSKRQNAFTFIIDGIVYVGGGANSGGMEQTMWAYDVSKDVWTEKNDLQEDNKDTDLNDSGYTISRENSVPFVINGLGYVVGGTRSGSLSQEVWEYNPSTDNWTKKTPFQGTARTSAVGYSLGSRGYVITGRSGSARLDDIWSFDPKAVHVN